MPSFALVARSRRTVRAARARLAVLMILVAGPVAVTTTTDDSAWAGSPNLEITMSRDRITIEVDEMPIGELLEMIAAEAGFEVEMRGNMDEPVS